MTIKLQAAARLRATSEDAIEVDAAAVPDATKEKLLTQIFKKGRLGKAGFKFANLTITGDDEDALRTALNKMGWVKKWKSGAIVGLSLADNTWPLVMTKNGDTLTVQVHNQDTTKKSVMRKDVASYKALIKETAELLGAKVRKWGVTEDKRGAYAEVKNGAKIPPRTATKAMQAAGYKKPMVEDNNLTFKKEHAKIVLQYSEDKMTLERMGVFVI